MMNVVMVKEKPITEVWQYHQLSEDYCYTSGNRVFLKINDGLICIGQYIEGNLSKLARPAAFVSSEFDMNIGKYKDMRFAPDYRVKQINIEVKQHSRV